MAKIHFHSEHPDFTIKKKNEVSDWISSSCKAENAIVEMLAFIFCTDDALHKINITHLNHDYLTDVITFPYSEGETLSGDIFISIDRVKDNAKQLSINWFDELCRVMIHGVLHLCGYGDKTESEKAQMREKEDYYLSLRSF